MRGERRQRARGAHSPALGKRTSARGDWGELTTLTIRVREETAEQRPAGLHLIADLGAVMLLPAHKTEPEGPVEILISSGQLQEMVEGRAIDLDGMGALIEGGRFVEDYLVVGVESHDD
jgi:hypothetical protein